MTETPSDLVAIETRISNRLRALVEGRYVENYEAEVRDLSARLFHEGAGSVQNVMDRIVAMDPEHAEERRTILERLWLDVDAVAGDTGQRLPGQAHAPKVTRPDG